ncbi:phosphopantetheine-binding protein [Micromonospora matsumotoense]|uniref:acyl carrier protein n=1 Tax=Micromonospora matsumotoense TaxID=121616 RepID=UPI0034032180
MNSLHHRIGVLLTDRFGVEPAAIRPDSTLDELHLDSLALVEFAEVLQSEFDVSISDDDISQTASVDDIVALLTAMGAPR